MELAKDWRTDRMLRRLEALLVVADKEHQFLLSGSGDVIEPDEGIAAVGSGGPFARAAALALIHPFRSGCRGHRKRSHADCRPNLHLHQSRADVRKVCLKERS